MATLRPEHGPEAFLFNMPATWQTPAARRLYLSELRRLGIWLAERGGHSPDKEQLIQAFLQAELPVQPVPRVETAPGTIRLALIGAPRLAEHRELETILARLGACLALDATVSGLGGQPTPIDHRTLREDPLAAVAEAYFDAIPGLFRRPNSDYYTWLSRQLTACPVHGFIALRYPWCDLRHAEVAHLHEWADRPMLDLEAGEDGRLDARALSRLQAFLEMLR
jgi:benzoyl-CoA reductase/2-hydroxyglutaryl-CoA dehydratase subunit BcrC/BadD/HgdB